MYHVATRRDIDDPGTLEAFTDEVQGGEGLRNLYLLTVADVSTTSPTALTSWKARMLDELYVAAERRLGGSRREDTDLAHEAKLRVQELWPESESRPFLDQFLERMPERYLYANEPHEIVRHARFVQASQDRAAVSIISSDPHHTELAFVAGDRPGLLAIFTATLAAARLEVVGAQVYNFVDERGQMRADLFWVKGTDDRTGRARLARTRNRPDAGREAEPEARCRTGSGPRWSASGIPQRLPPRST
jgi:[protein-PII] uridylyltransferase